MNWRYLLGACVLAAYLLIRAGVPLVPVAAGLVFACGLTWTRRNRGTLQPSTRRPVIRAGK